MYNIYLYYTSYLTFSDVYIYIVLKGIPNREKIVAYCYLDDTHNQNQKYMYFTNVNVTCIQTSTESTETCTADSQVYRNTFLHIILDYHTDRRMTTENPVYPSTRRGRLNARTHKHTRTSYKGARTHTHMQPHAYTYARTRVWSREKCRSHNIIYGLPIRFVHLAVTISI